MGTSLPTFAGQGVTAPADRLTDLFELHHARLVRTVRARLGRYDWHLAEDIAGATWVRAAEKIGQLRADDAHAFGWLARLAWTAQVDHFRLARNTREVPTSPAALAYRLPEWSAEEHALARLTVLIRRDDATAREAVAA